MKLIFRIALALLLPAIAATAQTGTPPRLSDFAGTYSAEFHKKTWLVLTLSTSGDALTGTLKHAIEISSDDEGDITKVGDDMSSNPVVQAEMEGPDLKITTKDDDGGQDFYILTLTGADTAELRSDIGNGSRSPKPFKLKRSVPQPANSKAAPQGGSGRQNN
jgi:hypothetical protein